MGTGPNNCPGILRGKDTIEGERGGGERRRRGGRGEERREVQIQLRSGVILDPTEGSSNVQIAESAGESIMGSYPTAPQ